MIGRIGVGEREMRLIRKGRVRKHVIAVFVLATSLRGLGVSEDTARIGEFVTS